MWPLYHYQYLERNADVRNQIHCKYSIAPLLGLRFVQEIKIIFKYRDCLYVLRTVICKYKDLTTVCLIGLVRRNEPVKFSLDLIAYFEYNSYMKICHFNTTNIESISFIND